MEHFVFLEYSPICSSLPISSVYNCGLYLFVTFTQWLLGRHSNKSSWLGWVGLGWVGLAGWLAGWLVGLYYLFSLWLDLILWRWRSTHRQLNTDLLHLLWLQAANLHAWTVSRPISTTSSSMLFFHLLFGQPLFLTSYTCPSSAEFAHHVGIRFWIAPQGNSIRRFTSWSVYASPLIDPPKCTQSSTCFSLCLPILTLTSFFSS